MKRSTKQFVITTETKNSLGFRVRTAGIELADYNNNPLMLWMHQRPKGTSKEEVLPIGNMLDVTLKENKLFGTPAFDATDDFAVKLYDKVENGTLRMLSAGLLPLSWSKDADGDIWLETSKLKEVSLVDIGSNSEALAVTLYDESDRMITLSLEEITNNLKPEIDMKLIQLNADVLPLLKLADGATAEDVQTAIGNLITLAETKEQEVLKLTNERNDFETKLDAEVKKSIDARNLTLVTLAADENKFVKGEIPNWLKLAEADYEGTKKVLDGMTGQKKVADQLTGDEKLSNEFVKLSWSELEAKNMLLTLKDKDFPLFKEKFKAEFNVEYKQ